MHNNSLIILEKSSKIQEYSKFVLKKVQKRDRLYLTKNKREKNRIVQGFGIGGLEKKF